MWQPIETAPKDGTRVRLGHDLEPSFHKPNPIFGRTTGRWNGKAWDMSALFIIPGGRYGMMSNAPTHWMPLPAPPADVEREG